MSSKLQILLSDFCRGPSLPSPGLAVTNDQIEDIEQVADEWRQLCEEGPGNEPFYRPEWIAAYLRAFACDASLVLLTARAHSRMRAVLPLIHERRSFCGFPVRMLRSASNTHSCRSDLVHGVRDVDQAIAGIWDDLKSRPWDVICLRDVPEGGGAERLLALAANEGWPTGRWQTIRSPFVPMVGVQDPLAIPPKRSFRHNLRRRWSKASARWRVELHSVRHADDTRLEEFYALEKSGWKGSAGTAIASSPQTRLFYSLVAEAAARFDYLSMYLLRFDDVPVAGHFGLFHAGRYYTPKVAYDQHYASYGPGHLMVQAALRDCIDRGVKEFDFLGPAMPWKLEWTSQERQHSNCYIFRKNTFGNILQAAKFQLMSRLVALAPQALVARLRSVAGANRRHDLC